MSPEGITMYQPISHSDSEKKISMKYPHCIPIKAPLYHHIFCRKVLLNVQPAVVWAGVSKAEVGTRALTWRKEVPGGDIHVGEDIHWDDIYNV